MEREPVVESSEKRTKVTEPLQVWRGTNVDFEFDGNRWFVHYQDDKTGEWSEEDHSEYTLEELADKYSESLYDGICRGLQTNVDVSSGRSVTFNNENSEQAKLFQKMVEERMNKLLGRKWK